MSELTIVTAASSNHFSCLTNLLFSLATFEPGTRTVVYDLGLLPAQVDQLQRLDNCDEVRRFHFENFPPHVKLCRHRGAYAWKPIIVAEMLAESGGTLLWLDSGNLAHGRLDRTRETLRTHGLWSPPSSGTIQQWTHPATLDYLKVGPELLGRQNRNAAIVGLSADHQGVDELVQRWKACALDPHCIAPIGATVKNHRYDQAVLSVLMYQFEQKYGCALADWWLEISTHNDRLSREEVCRRIFPAGLAPAIAV